MISATGKIRFTANYYRIITDYLNILPADFYVVICRQEAEAFPFAPYYDRNDTACAGVNFNVAYHAESATGFSINHFFVSQLCN